MRIAIMERISSSQRILLIISDSEKVKNVMNAIVVLNASMFNMESLHIIVLLVFIYIRVLDARTVLDASA
jgi:hypothetical protein